MGTHAESGTRSTTNSTSRFYEDALQPLAPLNAENDDVLEANIEQNGPRQDLALALDGLAEAATEAAGAMEGREA